MSVSSTFVNKTIILRGFCANRINPTCWHVTPSGVGGLNDPFKWDYRLSICFMPQLVLALNPLCFPLYRRPDWSEHLALITSRCSCYSESVCVCVCACLCDSVCVCMCCREPSLSFTFSRSMSVSLSTSLRLLSSLSFHSLLQSAPRSARCKRFSHQIPC